MDRAARVLVNLEYLGQVLNLPPGYRVAATRPGLNHDLEMLVRGPDLPLCKPGQEVEAAYLLCRREVRHDGAVRTVASFSCLPELTWELTPWRPSVQRPELEELLRKAAQHHMTPLELWEQRVSFVFGQLMDCSPTVTREQVEEAAARVYGPRPQE